MDATTPTRARLSGPLAGVRLGLEAVGPLRGPLLVALSGGADSTGLLGLLHGLREAGEIDVDLVAAHLDHGLRASSGRDRRAAARTCRRLGIPLVDGRAAVDPAGDGKGPEAAAREARYRFLGRTARLVEAPAVATAHHADDDLETVLLGLHRGSVRLARGIPRSRPLDDADPPVRVVRPALGLPRAALRRAARHLVLPTVEDPQNRSMAFLRNRLRHRLLPALRSHDPGLDGRLRELASRARRAVARTGGVPDRSDPAPDPSLVPRLETRSLEVPGVTELPAIGRSLRARVRPGSRADLPRPLPGPDEAWLDADRTGLDLVCRARRPGDRLRHLGAPGRGKLKDLLIDRKVPARRRDGVPLVCGPGPDGPLLWVGGVEIAHRARLTDRTRRILHLVLE